MTEDTRVLDPGGPAGAAAVAAAGWGRTGTDSAHYVTDTCAFRR